MISRNVYKLDIWFIVLIIKKLKYSHESMRNLYLLEVSPRLMIASLHTFLLQLIYKIEKSIQTYYYSMKFGLFCICTFIWEFED